MSKAVIMTIELYSREYKLTLQSLQHISNNTM